MAVFIAKSPIHDLCLLGFEDLKEDGGLLLGYSPLPVDE